MADCARPSRHRSNYFRTGLSFVVLSFLLSCTILAQDFQKAPAAPTTVVVGSDNPLIDVPAVQAAVNQGGTVILSGTFDFGTHSGNHIIVPGRAGAAQDEKGKSTVFIYQNDVTIVGETGPRGELLTVVKNGMPPFWIGWDGEVSRVPYPGTNNVDYGTEIFPVDVMGRVRYRDGTQDPGFTVDQTRYARAYQNVSAAIKFIRFDSPKHNGVKAAAGRNVYVIGNVFENVEFGGLVHGNGVFAANRVAAGFVAVGSLFAPFVGPAITGRIVAEGNVINDAGTELIYTYAGESVGIAAIATLAEVRIERNEVRNVGRKTDGTVAESWAVSIVVTENYAVSPVVAHNSIYNCSGIGIADLVLFAPSPAPSIEHNAVVNCVNGIMTSSAIGPRNGLLVHQNLISQDGAMGAGESCVLAVGLSESVLRANKFSGDWTGPLVVLLNSTDNVLLENRDLRQANPLLSPTYFLDALTSDNLIRAGSGTAFDLGTNNKIYLPR